MSLWPTSFETGMAVIPSNHFQTLFCAMDHYIQNAEGFVKQSKS
jgi:hypothetical protein